MTTVRTPLRGESGMGIIEVMVGVALFTVALFPAYEAFDSSVRHQSDAQRQTELETAADIAMQTMVRELRQAYSGGASETAIRTLSQTPSFKEIEFTIPNRTTPFRMQLVRYRLNVVTRVLERHMVESTNTGSAPWLFPPVPSPVPYTVIATGVSSPALFSAFDKNGISTSVVGVIRKIEVAFDVDLDPSSGPSPRHYESAVTLRSTIVNPGV